MNKRSIPRHVDGRVKIGPMTALNFIKFFPIFIIEIFVILSKFNPITLFIGVLVIGLTIILFAEFNNKETGLDILKDIIKYELEGDIIYERGCGLKDVHKIVWNKIEDTKEK